MFVDCGAPSLYNRLSRNADKHDTSIMGTSFADRKHDTFDYTETDQYQAYLEDYIAFVNAHPEIDVYSNLDVINNPQLTWANQRRMEDAGATPIPVFHLSNKESEYKWLRRYVRKYEYIAIGGVVPNPPKETVPLLDRLFNEYLTDDDGFPIVKVHGFACTSLLLMRRYPWYSVDSTTARKLAAYGRIAIPTACGTDVYIQDISARDVELRYRMKGAGRKLRVIEEINERHGWPFSLDLLSSDGLERTAWNHLVYSAQLQKELPEWPWSIKTRKSKKGATERLHYSFAGSLSAKEEVRFWQRLEDANEPEAVRHRLHSFFYKSQVQRILKLREEGA